jgi:hypothetical protein
MTFHSFIHSGRFAVSGHRPWNGLILVRTVILCYAVVRGISEPVVLHVDVIALPQCPLSRETAF